MNHPTYVPAECCGTCLYYEWIEGEEGFSVCTRDEEVDEPTISIMVCEAYAMDRELIGRLPGGY